MLRVRRQTAGFEWFIVIGIHRERSLPFKQNIFLKHILVLVKQVFKTHCKKKVDSRLFRVMCPLERVDLTLSLLAKD